MKTKSNAGLGTMKDGHEGIEIIESTGRNQMPAEVCEQTVNEKPAVAEKQAVIEKAAPTEKPSSAEKPAAAEKPAVMEEPGRGRLADGTYATVITKEDAVRMIREAAEKLGHAPSSAELEDLTPIRRWHIRRIFKTYSWALHECGLGQRYNGQRIPVELLFKEWTAVARRLRRLPSITEFNETSKYTSGPYQRRFLSWGRVPHGMREFAKKHGLEAEWQDVMRLIENGHGESGLATTGEWLTSGMKQPVIRSDRPVYGPAMVPAALVHEPINEMGVVYLFGTVAERLGYMVTLVQVEFPDCEALQQVGPQRWQRIKIEFEYESRNFLRHGHKAEDCDMIVCWVHNWPECPLEVVELREVVRRSN